MIFFFLYNFAFKCNFFVYYLDLNVIFGEDSLCLVGIFFFLGGEISGILIFFSVPPPPPFWPDLHWEMSFSASPTPRAPGT